MNAFDPQTGEFLLKKFTTDDAREATQWAHRHHKQFSAAAFADYGKT